MPVRQPFLDSCLESYWSAPSVARMKAQGPGGQWADELLRLSGHERVAALRQVLTEVAHNGLRTLDPINRFRNEEAPGIPSERYAQASAFGVEQLPRSAAAAYVITLASVIGWATSLGDHLYEQRSGFPERGWLDIPHAYAQATLKVGDVRGALQVVNEAYDVLMAAKYHYDPDLIRGIASYRLLAGSVGRRLQQVIDNLSDDLSRSALRTHLLALMWTLGFVPECESLRRSGKALSRSMLRTLIRLSIDRIPEDPLTQYVWLEMKDKPSLDLRGHHFFYLINRRYNQYLPDETWPVIPSQLYAQTLIRWLGGSLGLDDVAAYLHISDQVRDFEEIRQHLPGTSDWSVYLRMRSLAYLLADEHDMLAGDPSPAQQLETWRSLTGQVTRMRGQHHLNPHRADLEGTLNYPLFHLIEHAPDAAQIVHDLESYRAAAMTFPLVVTPPATPTRPGSTITQQLDRERELIRWLRGAYFVINYEFLPQHFRRHTHLGYPGEGSRGLDLETGRNDYLEVERLLGELYGEMNTTAAEYAARRRDPTASAETIARALGQHTGTQINPST
jgi:hypothetical protein